VNTGLTCKLWLRRRFDKTLPCRSAQFEQSIKFPKLNADKNSFTGELTGARLITGTCLKLPGRTELQVARAVRAGIQTVVPGM
jgi:hypothetical protein